MKLRRLFLIGCLVAAAWSLAVALATRDGVGPFEYVVGIAIVGGLLFAAVRMTRRAIPRA
jgi:hypothetical protein